VSFYIVFRQSANSLRPIRPISAKYLIKALKIEKDEPIEIAKGFTETKNFFRNLSNCCK
jgi:hypothetical protein